MDRIKKLKVKKSDGSFTDYIPVGTDAIYVDLSDGSNVESEINNLKSRPVNIIKYYDNIAAMKVDTKLKENDVVQTLGYYKPNDGGSGLYRIVKDDSLIEDGGSVHNLENGLKAELIIENKINVKQFGAKGDSTTDDTKAIQTAINCAEKHNFITVFLPAGTYIVSSTLNTSRLFNRINLIGDNRKEVTIQMKSNENIPILVTAGGSGSLTGNVIKNIIFKGVTDTATNNMKTIGIHVKGVTGMNIINCTFSNLDKGILLENDSSNFTEFVIARYCDFRQCKNCLRSLRTGNQYSFHGCGMENCTIGESANTDSVIYIDQGCQFYNAPFDFTVWKQNTSPLIYLNGSNDYLVQTRQLFAYGNIRIEGQQTFNVFDGENISRMYYQGNIMGLGSNYTLGKATLTNLQRIGSNGAPSAMILPYSISIKNIKNGDNLAKYIAIENKASNIKGNLKSGNFEAIMDFTFFRVPAANYYRVVKNYLNGFNRAGLNLDNFSFNFLSSDQIIFNYTGPDKDTRVFSFDITITQLDNRPVNTFTIEE